MERISIDWALAVGQLAEWLLLPPEGLGSNPAINRARNSPFYKRQVLLGHLKWHSSNAAMTLKSDTFVTMRKVHLYVT